MRQRAEADRQIADATAVVAEYGIRRVHRQGELIRVAFQDATHRLLTAADLEAACRQGDADGARLYRAIRTIADA